MININSIPDLLAYFKGEAHNEISQQVTMATNLLTARMKEQGKTSIKDSVDVSGERSLDGNTYRVRVFVEEGQEVKYGLSEIVLT